MTAVRQWWCGLFGHGHQIVERPEPFRLAYRCERCHHVTVGQAYLPHGAGAASFADAQAAKTRRDLHLLRQREKKPLRWRRL